VAWFAGLQLRELRPQLPRAAWLLQAGGLASAVGNGVVLPFIVIYLRDVRGFGLATATLIVASLNGFAILTTPGAGAFIDRLGARAVLVAALFLLAAGYGSFALVERPWQAFAAAAVAGLGNGGMAPAYATLLANVSPNARRHVAFALRRMSDNLGVAIGAAVGGIVASSLGTGGFQALFLADAFSFLAFAAALVAVPTQAKARAGNGGTSYRAVLRRGLVVRLFALNVALFAAGYGAINAILPVFLRGDIGLGTSWIGGVFVCNMLAVVVLQLPVARLLEGRRRMPAIALQGALWALAWLLVFGSGFAPAAAGAGLLVAFAAIVFGIGEALSGAVHRPLFADLAPPRLLGRYTALFDLSLRLGLTLGPGLGGFLFAELRQGYWLLAAAVCLVAGLATWALEPTIPREARVTPQRLADGVAQTAGDPSEHEAHLTPLAHPGDGAHAGDSR
jgi:MFS family permease